MVEPELEVSSHWCGIGFRWREAAGSCTGFLQCWASVTLLTPGSSGERTWLVFLALNWLCGLVLFFFFFNQEDLPSNPIRVPRSHPQWSWCVLRLLGCQKIQSPSSHPKWTFQSQKGGSSLNVPIISNLEIWTCSLLLGSRKNASGVFSGLCFPVPLCCSKIGKSPFQLFISEKETVVTVLKPVLEELH